MRLSALLLNRYGSFEAERIGFDARPGVLNLLIAPNGAGKSVLRTAFCDLLFGIHPQTAMAFRFGYPGMRISAEIMQADGSCLTLERRKARGNTLTAADGAELDPAVAGALLGNRDRILLERLFALDTERLRKGGEALLASGGDLASALLSASGGISEARRLLKCLEKERDDLAPVRRVAQRPFYRALDSHAEARRRITAAQIKPEERQAQQDQLEALEQQQRAFNAAAEAASVRIAQLERVRRVRPVLAERDAAVAWLEANPDAPCLPADLGTRLGEAHIGFVKAEADAGNAARALAVVEAQAEAVVVDAALLAQADAIEALVGEAGAAAKAVADLPGVTAQHDAVLARIGDLLRQLGSDLPPLRAGEAIPQRTVQARTQQLIRAYAEPVAAMREAPARLAARRRDLAEIEAQLAELPAAQEPRGLEALVREIGDAVARREEAARAHAEAGVAVAAMLGRVPGWQDDAGALAALKPLPDELYARHDADVRAATGEEALARARHAAEAQSLQAARAKYAELASGGLVPDEAAVERARARREAVWRLIYRHAFSADRPTPEEERAVTQGAPLPLVFERAMAAADAVADQRARESDLLARIDEARRAVAAQEAVAAEAAERLAVAQQTGDAARRGWMQICSALPLGGSPALADVQAFALARERVLETVARHAASVHALEAVTAKHAAWAQRLGEMLAAPDGDLAALLARARQALEAGADREKARVRLETRRLQAAKELRETEAAVAEAERRLDAWRGDWQALLAELDRPVGEDPAVTEEVLRLLAEIEAEHKAAIKLAERISGIEREVNRFGQSVRAVAGAEAGADPFGVTRDLAARLGEQKQLRKQRDLLCSQRDSARLALETLDAVLGTARAERDALLCGIGADSVEAAQGRLALAEMRARFERQRAVADAKLPEAGDGFAVGQLQAEVAAVAPDKVQGRLDALGAERREASAAAQTTLGALTELRLRMAAQEADTDIHAASADRQAAVATVSHTLDEAMLLHAAASMLEMALKTVEETGDSGLLLRIGGIFSALTLGAYTRVTSEADGDGAARLVLLQQAFPDERQTVDQLSEGTRDQLFLALRVAEIERHLAGATPLPFIGDDILQTFDDDRALAAMRVLIELSSRTQVILLTHHRHVLDLAARLPEGSVHVCLREPAVSLV